MSEEDFFEMVDDSDDTYLKCPKCGFIAIKFYKKADERIIVISRNFEGRKIECTLSKKDSKVFEEKADKISEKNLARSEARKETEEKEKQRLWLKQCDDMWRKASHEVGGVSYDYEDWCRDHPLGY